MSQNPNGPDYNNPYGPGPSNPNYPPSPGTGYGSGQPPSGPNPTYGQPPSGPNSNYGQPTTGPNPGYAPPPSGPNPNYGQYAPPPPPPPIDPTPNSNYGTPPYNSAYPQAGPYDQTVLSQSSGTAYPAYPTPSNPGFGTPISNPGFGAPVSNPGFGMPPTPPPAKKSNARIILISVIVLLLVAGSILAGVLYNNHQTTVHNNFSTATAQKVQATGTAQTQASATANAQATATYVQTHYPFSSNLVLNDPLKDNSGVAKYGWDVGSECTFTNGAYEATEKQANFILPCAAESTHFSNFTFEVQMTIKTGGTGAEGGVIFRADMNTYALYILFIDTDGNYSLDLRANSSGDSTRKLSSGQVSNFATGFYQVHTIGIVANGSQITAYIDQNQVAKVTDATYSNGQIGVISDYGSSATTVAYSNAKVWEL